MLLIGFSLLQGLFVLTRHAHPLNKQTFPLLVLKSPGYIYDRLYAIGEGGSGIYSSLRNCRQ